MTIKIIEDDIYIKNLSVDNITGNYLKWMNNSDNTVFLESKYKALDIDDLKDYVRKMKNSSNDFMFGIYIKDNDEHIGNIKIGGINWIHKFADIGLMVGETKYKGKGYGTKSIIACTRFAFEQLNLNSVHAGVYENNIASYKAFIKAGYSLVGKFTKKRFFEGKYIDEYIFEKVKE